MGHVNVSFCISHLISLHSIELNMIILLPDTKLAISGVVSLTCGIVYHSLVDCIRKSTN